MGITLGSGLTILGGVIVEAGPPPGPTSGYLYSWGRNTVGQLGLGNTTNYSSPKQVGAVATWLTVAAGPYWSMAIRS